MDKSSAQKRMGCKAYKLSIPQLKSILDLLVVDRYGKTTKDDLVDQLLDFLGEPRKSYLKKGGGSHRKSESKSKGKSKKGERVEEGDEEEEEEEAEEEEEEAEEDEEQEQEDADDVQEGKKRKEKGVADENGYDDVGDEPVDADGKMPSDEILRRWVRAFVRCHNMKSATIKKAVEIASEKFGVDMSGTKQRLKELLTEEM